jgi:acetyltransferase
LHPAEDPDRRDIRAIHPVNPKGGSLLGRRFLASLDEIDGPVDVALLVRPAAECVGAVRDVARRGIPFAIPYAAGFSELGEEGRALERAMVEAAASGGTRLVGPNGMNVFSAPARLNLSGIVPFPVGGLGFLSASGNLGYALAHEAARSRAVGFSRFVSAGNQADLALHDYLDFLQADPHTRAVLVYTEGFVPGGARPFLECLARTAAEKPVLVLRGGRTREGRGTARSHTGALAGSPEVARAALEQAGALLVERADEVLAMAQALLESPLPRGPRVALVGEGGGHDTLLTDAVVEAGLLPEPFPGGLAEALSPHLPPFVAIRANPLELGGRSEYDLDVYRNVLGPVMDWRCDQLILFGATRSTTTPSRRSSLAGGTRRASRSCFTTSMPMKSVPPWSGCAPAACPSSRRRRWRPGRPGPCGARAWRGGARARHRRRGGSPWWSFPTSCER